jgi:transposase
MCDINPIEMVFSKIKAYLRGNPSGTFEQIVQRLAESLDSFSQRICTNLIRHAKYTSN